MVHIFWWEKNNVAIDGKSVAYILLTNKKNVAIDTKKCCI